MRVRRNLNAILAVTAFLALTIVTDGVFAQATAPPPPPPPGGGVPIDGGVIALIVGGAMYGSKKLYDATRGK